MKKLLIAEVVAAGLLTACTNSLPIKPISSTNNSLLRSQELPVEVVLRAWTSPAYRDNLLKNSNSVLGEYWKIAQHMEYVVHENNSTTRNYKLPIIDDGLLLLTPEELERRMNDDAKMNPVAYKHVPPLNILARALVDEEFKNCLLSDPVDILPLRAGSFLTDITCLIHEDKPNRQHLILDTSPNNLRQLESLERRIMHLADCSGGCHTTKCGATGTC